MNFFEKNADIETTQAEIADQKTLVKSFASNVGVTVSPYSLILGQPQPNQSTRILLLSQLYGIRRTKNSSSGNSKIDNAFMVERKGML